MSSMGRLVAHLAGDYVLQSDWEAMTKVKRTREGWAAAAAHALTYTACFFPLTRDWRRLAVIGGTHLLLDHFRPLPPLLAAKNALLSPRGYVSNELPFWLHILVDNSCHLAINELALRKWRR